MPENARIRKARLEQADLLTALTMRSKAHWRYDAAFLAASRRELEFRPEKFLPEFHVYVLEQGATIVGFYSLIPLASEMVELHELFVDRATSGKASTSDSGIMRLISLADWDTGPWS